MRLATLWQTLVMVAVVPPSCRMYRVRERDMRKHRVGEEELKHLHRVQLRREEAEKKEREERARKRKEIEMQREAEEVRVRVLCRVFDLSLFSVLILLDCFSSG